MGLLQLDPEALAARQPDRVPTLGSSLLIGALGFIVVSVGGFAPWALAGSSLYHFITELGVYALCAFTFVALSGVCLHRLIIGPRALWRFYALFTPAFLAYAVAWTCCWFWSH